MSIPEAEKTFAPKCIWCGADWSEDNIKLDDLDAADHCEWGRFDSPTCTISIVCHACGKEMYRKEGKEIGY